MPPTQAELEALAERALTFLDGAGQAGAWWEFRARQIGPGVTLSERTQVALAVAGGGQIVTDRTDDAGLRSAAAGAAALPSRHEGRLPDPEPGRAHDGYDPRAI